MIPGTVSLQCVSWNVAGKYGLFKLDQLQKYLEKFDIICLTETHTIQKGSINFPMFKVYEFPDSTCNHEYPRGGICVLIKQNVRGYIKQVKLLMTDFIEIIFTNNSKLVYTYIPPIDSAYYDEQYIELLCSIFMEGDEDNIPVISMGDINSRLGNLSDINDYTYSDNVDQRLNENGRHLKQVLFTSTSAIPVNHLQTNDRKFEGGFTFSRNEKRSQIDWCFVNRLSLPSIRRFIVDTQCPAISDHHAIATTIEVDGECSVNMLLKAAQEINVTHENHSKVPLVSSRNTNLTCLNELLKIEVQKLTPTNMSSHNIADFLYSKIQQLGRICKEKKTTVEMPCSTPEQITRSFQETLQRTEEAKWRYVRESKDSKGLWDSINIKGQIKETEESHIDVNELAEVHSNKSRIDPSQVYLKDISTNKVDDDMDKKIDETEIEAAVDKLKESKTSDGVGVSTVKVILPSIMHLLVILYNYVFEGGAEAYPSSWISFVNGIPKKGHLILPKLVRFNTIMRMFEKIYQIILSSRLYAFLKIPFQQTVYHIGKGCNLHVMTIRFMKVLTKKTKQKLVIVFTDFEAAFDLVSRRLLFKKLVKLGISAGLLTALIAIYESSKSVAENGNEYSDYLILFAGVKQGAPPSGLLYIAYTMSLIDEYKIKFNPEPLIGILHLLMHADDILMLATCHNIAFEKVKCLIQFCKENYIRLQITKCAVMCVNGSEEDATKSMTFDDLILSATSCEVYLGSSITNSTKISDDVDADIKMRQCNVVKYFAFLRSNANAPIDVKTKVLDACIMMSLLYNAETWADVKSQKLETVYRRMLKAVLGVGMTTCSDFLYIELGVLSIKTRVMVKQWKFWKKVMEMDSNPLLYVIELGRKYKLKEVLHYDKLLSDFASAEEIVENFFETIRKSIQKKAEEGKSKYITYMEINPGLETPEVYYKIKNKNHRAMIAKLRMSSHNLQIEMGRRIGLKREERICCCGVDVETEKHFLLECGLYQEVREKHGVDRNCTIESVLSDDKYVDYILECAEARKKFV